MDLLEACCLRAGVKLSSKQLESIGIFLRELMSWNKRMNLTGPLSEERIIEELIADSVMPSPFLPDEGSVLDVGSGAGFPALPLKICKPELQFFLLEPRSKRVSFLKHVIRCAELKKIQVLKGRIEEVASDFPFEKFDIVTSRAVTSLSRVVEWCTPYLREGGLLVTFQGHQFKDIVKGSRTLLGKNRLIIHQSMPYKLSVKNQKRNLLILKKKSDCD